MMTLNAALERARGFPATGLRFLDRHERERFVPWSDVHARASAVAGALRARGVRRGERVALVFQTGPEFFEAFFGALLAGAVPTPLYPPVRLGRLREFHERTARMIEVTSARVVLAEKQLERLLGESIAAARPPLGCTTVAELLARFPGADPSPVEVAAHDLALVQFSSGTTVDPKPVALTHAAMLAQVEALITVMETAWPEVDGLRHAGVSWLPLYHDMGLIGCVFPALLRPAVLTLIAPDVFLTRPASWLRAMGRYRGTISPAPNFAYGLCVAKIRDVDLEGVDLSGWRIALCGAEPVAPAVLRAFAERFQRWGFRPEALTPVYGLSEAALAVTFSALDRPFVVERFDRAALAGEGRAVRHGEGRELVSLGRPIPGFRVEIRDAEGVELGEDRVGTVHASGPSLMAGYLDRPEETGRALRNGWLDTGDLGFLHDGELFLTGRAKDVLIVRGENHSPEEVEHAIDEVAGVRTGCSAAASWLCEGGEGESVTLFVEHLRDATPAQREHIPARCREAVQAAVRIHLDDVVVVAPGTLPRTSSGKIRRAETVRRHLAGELTPPDRVTALGLLGAMVRSRRAMKRAGRA